MSAETVYYSPLKDEDHEPSAPSLPKTPIKKLFTLEQNEMKVVGVIPVEEVEGSLMSEVHDYSESRLAHLLVLQSRTTPLPGFITRQHQFSWKDRCNLVCWMIELMDINHSQPESLYLAVNILDRALSVRVFTREKIKLLALAAVWLAWKYEENRLVRGAMTAKRMRFISGDRFHEKEIVAMEEMLLNLLNFDMSAPSVEVFLQFKESYVESVLQDKALVPHAMTLARFYAESSLLNESLSGFLPSLIAEGAIHIALQSLGAEAAAKDATGQTKTVALMLHHAARTLPLSVQAKYQNRLCK